MKTSSIRISTLTWALVLLLTPFTSARAVVCDDPLRDQSTCNQMFHLRAGVNLLDEQRDLMQVNYSLLATVADDLNAVVNRVLTTAPSSHLSALQGVAQATAQLSTDARAKNQDSLVTANRVRAQCMACHGGDIPSSGHKWTDITRNSWERVLNRCNEDGRNPYLCKNMYGLASANNYLMTAWDAGVENFEATQASAQEIIRIANTLNKEGLFHGRKDMMDAVKKEAEEVSLLAQNHDRAAFERGRMLTVSCAGCHKTP